MLLQSELRCCESVACLTTSSEDFTSKHGRSLPCKLLYGLRYRLFLLNISFLGSLLVLYRTSRRTGWFSIVNTVVGGILDFLWTTLISFRSSRTFPHIFARSTPSQWRWLSPGMLTAFIISQQLPLKRRWKFYQTSLCNILEDGHIHPRWISPATSWIPRLQSMDFVCVMSKQRMKSLCLRNGTPY